MTKAPREKSKVFQLLEAAREHYNRRAVWTSAEEASIQLAGTKALEKIRQFERRIEHLRAKGAELELDYTPAIDHLRGLIVEADVKAKDTADSALALASKLEGYHRRLEVLDEALKTCDRPGWRATPGSDVAEALVGFVEALTLFSVQGPEAAKHLLPSDGMLANVAREKIREMVALAHELLRGGR